MNYIYNIQHMTKDEDNIIRWKDSYLFKSFWNSAEKEKEAIKRAETVCKRIEARNEFVNFKSFYTEEWVF